MDEFQTCATLSSLLERAGYRANLHGSRLERIDQHGNRHTSDYFEISDDGQTAIRPETGEAYDLVSLRQWIRENIAPSKRPLCEMLWEEPAIGFAFSNPAMDAMTIEDALSRCSAAHWFTDAETMEATRRTMPLSVPDVFIVAPKLQASDVSFILQNMNPSARHVLRWNNSMQGEANAAVFSMKKAGRRFEVFTEGDDLTVRDFSSTRQTTFPNYKTDFGHSRLCAVLGIEDALVSREIPGVAYIGYGGGQSPQAQSGRKI